jgi:hypothetical protein
MENEIATPEIIQDVTPKEVQEITERQQAGVNRVVEINEALLPAYQKAGTLVLTDAEREKLIAPFPDSLVAQRPHDKLLYIPHIAISDRLCQVFGPGQWSLLRRREWVEGNQIFAEWVLIVKGIFIGESIGAMTYHPSNLNMNYSDALEGTRGECLRRIAAKVLGCGSQVWYPDYAAKWANANKAATTSFRDDKWHNPTNGESPPEIEPQGPLTPIPEQVSGSVSSHLLDKMLDLAIPMCNKSLEDAEKMILAASAFPNDKGKIIKAKSFDHLMKSEKWAKSTLGKLKAQYEAFMKNETTVEEEKPKVEIPEEEMPF